MQQERIRKKLKFFKLMLPDPEILKQLQIPSEFTQHIHKSAFEKATLIDSSSRAWPVKFHENEKGVFVKDGWDRFFNDHSLGHFEFLVFIYDGKTRFRVKIFGKDGLERVFPIEHAASSGLMSPEYCSEDENKSVKEVVCDSPSREEAMAINGKRKRGRPRKKDGKKRGRPIGSKNRKRDRPTVSENKIIEEYSKKKEVEKCSKNKEIIEEIIEISDEEPGFRSRKINRKEVRDNICAKNNGFCSEFPFFEKWINLKNVHTQKARCVLTLPRTFAEKYLPKTNTKMVLTNEDGKSWTVNFVSEPHANRFYGGWVHFMRDNELKLGDLCIFELISENCMKVHISRSEKTGILHIENDKVFQSQGFRSKKTNRKEARDAVYAKNNGFCSTFPFFEKWIDLYNVNTQKARCQMRLPTTFAEKYLPKKHTEMVLTNEDGKSWTVNFVPLLKTYRFCGGWLYFMRDNELKVGDLCIFELISENCMKVHISHATK